MRARLAQLDPEALDLADPESLSDEVVEPHTADRELPPGLAGLESDALDDLGLDERERLAWGCAMLVEMTVAFEAFPGNDAYRVDGTQHGDVRSPEMNRLHRHTPIMPDPGAQVRRARMRIVPGRRMHADELETDAALVRPLLTAQFPSWAELPIEALPVGGTDNAIYRLGAELSVRLPRRREWTPASLDKEFEWLPKLAHALPLPVPTPLARGQPG
jgi:hypothetical protein